MQRFRGDSPVAHQLVISRHEMFDKARESLEKATRRMKKYADQHRRPLEFQIGDKVLLKLTSQILKKLVARLGKEG